MVAGGILYNAAMQAGVIHWPQPDRSFELGVADLNVVESNKSGVPDVERISLLLRSTPRLVSLGFKSCENLTPGVIKSTCLRICAGSLYLVKSEHSLILLL